MKSLSKVVQPSHSPKALERLQQAYKRVFFDGHASVEDREIVLSDIATYTKHFFQDGSNTSIEEIHQNNGRRSVMSRIIRLGFSENTNLSSLYEAAVAETYINGKEGKSL